MKVIKIDKKKMNQEYIDLIVDYLKKEKVVVLATDTIYGLHCLANSEKAIKKIIKIKERSASLGFVHLMKSYCQVHDYCVVNKKQDGYLRKYWPASTSALHNANAVYKKKPSTFILKSRGRLPTIASGGVDTIAVRLPKDDLLITILKKVNMPLISSSFNVSGKKEVPFSKVPEFFKTKPDLIADSGKQKKKASRIINIRNINQVQVIRK